MVHTYVPKNVLLVTFSQVNPSLKCYEHFFVYLCVGVPSYLTRPMQIYQN